MSTITYWLSLFFVFTIPWENMFDVGNIGTIARTAGLLLAVCWLALVIMSKRRLRKPHGFHYVFCVYVLWNYFSVFWTIDIDLTMGRVHSYPQLLAFTYILWDLYNEESKIKDALLAFVIGCWVNAGFILSLYLTGERIRSAIFVGTDFDPNNNGVILALGIPFAWYLFSMRQKSFLQSFLRILYFLYIPAAIFGILFTASRTALITLVVALSFILITQRYIRLWIRVLAIPVLIYAIYLIIPYVPEASLERLATAPENIAAGDLNGRIEIWLAGFDAFAKSPILGVGSHAFRSATSIGKLVHNTYLEILFELGIIGFIIFCILIFIVLKGVNNYPRQFRIFWHAILIVLGIGIFSLNWLHRKPTWFIPTMIIIQSAVVLTDMKDVHDRSSDVKKSRIGIESVKREPTLNYDKS